MRLTITLLAIAVLLGGPTIQANDSAGHGDAGFIPPRPCSNFDGMLAQAGEPPDPHFQGQGRMFGRQRMQQQRKHLEQLRMLKMLELLDLNEDQELSFLTSYRAMRQELRDIDEKRAVLVNRLADGLGGDSLSDDAIDALIDSVMVIEKQKQKVHESFIQQSRSILTPQQLGRLVVFHERFERELLDQVKAFREPRQENPTDGPPSP